MKQWMELVNNPAPGTEPINLYTDIHLGFTAIHPFADGNGRMARLLANIPILKAGLPPVIIALENRKKYLELMGDWSAERGAPYQVKSLFLVT